MVHFGFSSIILYKNAQLEILHNFPFDSNKRGFDYTWENEVLRYKMGCEGVTVSRAARGGARSARRSQRRVGPRAPKTVILINILIFVSARARSNEGVK